jgi:hypothetical protein
MAVAQPANPRNGQVVSARQQGEAIMGEKIKIKFHLDDDGKVTDAAEEDKDKGVTEKPEPPYSWASTIVTTKHSPTCIYVMTDSGWKKICF